MEISHSFRAQVDQAARAQQARRGRQQAVPRRVGGRLLLRVALLHGLHDPVRGLRRHQPREPHGDGREHAFYSDGRDHLGLHHRQLRVAAVDRGRLRRPVPPVHGRAQRDDGGAQLPRVAAEAVPHVLPPVAEHGARRQLPQARGHDVLRAAGRGGRGEQPDRCACSATRA